MDFLKIKNPLYFTFYVITLVDQQRLPDNKIYLTGWLSRSWCHDTRTG